jgi:hypothetical protein
VLSQKRRVLETVLGPQVLDHNGFSGDQGVSRLGLEVRTDRGPPHKALFPPHAGPQKERRAIWHDLEDLAVLDRQYPGDQVHGLVHEPCEAHTGERSQAEPARGLLLA